MSLSEREGGGGFLGVVDSEKDYQANNILRHTTTRDRFNREAAQSRGMSADELAAEVKALQDVDREAFEAEVEREAEELKTEIRDGTFDNSQAIIGLELELYAVDDRTDALKRVPRPLLERIGFEKELGLHNAEMQTSPQPLNSYGLRSQEQ